jgi:inosine-uridine nucleoside N-ribohydrolase
MDVDTGVDDALALALAVRHPNIQLEAVLSVSGNVGLELTTRNTLRVLDWLGASEVPVYAGNARPLAGPVREATHWHGVDGLGGAQLPDPKRPAAGTDAVMYLIETLMRAPGEITLVCTAPLTNLALAVTKCPEIVENVKEVVIMGGAARPPGNVTPTAEFNVYADPEAAAIVFQQSWSLTMVGLDVTNRVTLSRAERNALDSKKREAVLLREVTRHLFDVRGVTTMALHDPLALLVAIEPDLVTTIDADVDVETRGMHTLGQTVVDLRSSAPRPYRRTRVGMNVDVVRARAAFFQSLNL